jgi:hypothetical protein
MEAVLPSETFKILILHGVRSQKTLSKETLADTVHNWLGKPVSA